MENSVELGLAKGRVLDCKPGLAGEGMSLMST